MARPREREKRGPKDAARRGGKKKVCIFCKEKADWVDYKDVNLLRRFMSDRGKIRARRVTGNCAQHQREVAVAIKTARELALLPYTQRTMSERGPGRGGGRGGRDGGRDGGGPRGPRRDELAAEPAAVDEAVAGNGADDVIDTPDVDVLEIAADDGDTE